MVLNNQGVILNVNSNYKLVNFNNEFVLVIAHTC